MWFLLMLVILLTNGMSAFGLKVLAGWALPETVKFPYLTIWYAAGLASIAVPMLIKGLRIGRKEILWGGAAAALSIGGQVAMAMRAGFGCPRTRCVSSRNRRLHLRCGAGRTVDIRRAYQSNKRTWCDLGLPSRDSSWLELKCHKGDRKGAWGRPDQGCELAFHTAGAYDDFLGEIATELHWAASEIH